MSQALEKTVADSVLQWVTFRLDTEIYGINVMQVQEVLRYREVAPVPGAPAYVMGIINLRGKVVAVIDTRERFSVSKIEPNEHTRIVIIESDSNVVGILVDSVAEVVYLKQSEIEKTPSIGNDETNKFIQGVCHKNDKLIILLDISKILSDEEWGSLDNL